ncbi:hypothetical protein GE09DRAFT_657574 [Coniochaeta sp. 2T2.1]|nr:hypothetical protein GE09DRAFT_657574 [Coniochaeta sp. 2T2.1]
MAQPTSHPNHDVPDSTDWLNTPLSGLMSVEQAFRCHVCKDFYDSPMLTSCNHTFCSLCIRRCLAVDGKCPLCRKADQESRLRGNWALREAVDSFKECRASILDFAKRPVSNTTAASPKRRAMEIEDSDYEEAPSPKRTRRSTRSTRSRGAEAATAMSREEIESRGRGDPADDYIPDDGLVACPICQQRMKLEAVDRHIGTGACSGAPQPQSQIQGPILNGASTRGHSSSFLAPSKAKHPQQAKPLEPLPPLNYSMLKDKALRDKLHELHLSTYGNRRTLEQRHKEWVTIWNANCDSAHPKSRAELLRDLDTWERTMNKTPSAYAAQTAPPQVKDKDFDGASWSTNNDSSFKDLIAKARQSKRQAEQKAKETSAEEAARQPPGQPTQPQPQPPQLAEPRRPEQSTPQPAPGSQQLHVRGTDHSQMATMNGGGTNRYNDAIYDFDGQADFALRIPMPGGANPPRYPGPDDWSPPYQ